MRRTIFTALALTAFLPLPSIGASITVRPGDTLSDIAARNRVSVGALMRANGLSNSDFITAGSTLKLPGSAGNSVSAGTGRHRVSSGDTISTIAARYKVSQQALIAVNGLGNADYLVIGQTLKLPGSAGSSISAGTGRHRVSSGDTISTIATRYKVRQQDLITINGLRSADYVVLGQTLKLPKGAYIPQVKPKTVAIKANPKAISHTVARGQTLTQIARAYEVPVASLININQIANPNKVMAGTKLSLRVTPTTQAKPLVKTTVITSSKPKTQAKPKQQEIAIKPEAKPTVQSTIKPAKTAAKPSTNTNSTTQTSASKTQTKPQQKPVASKPATKSTINPAKTRTKPQISKVVVKPKTTKVASNAKKVEWRTYGPLQVDWTNWQSMGGSYVAPTLNRDGKSLYLAVNCPARKINATGDNGAWKTWSAPQDNFERALLNDLCKAKPNLS
ncbi:MAG: LysM peptidoglycan-binding domain-containing protein [Prochlorococcus sp.]|nr:LysM peptidoglycan-binding domain-containing protein [Prochlorococcus sp.]